MKKEITKEQIDATKQANELRKLAKNDNILAEDLGLSKVTLYTRLKNSNWKKSEIALIEILTKNIKLNE